MSIIKKALKMCKHVVLVPLKTVDSGMFFLMFMCLYLFI